VDSEEVVDSIDRLLAYPFHGKYWNAHPTSNHKTFRELYSLGLLSEKDIVDLADITRCVESDAGLTSNPRLFDEWLRIMSFLADGVGRSQKVS